MISDRFEIDVGGTVFATSKGTLRRFPESFFGRLLERWADQETSRCFVDRSPGVFGLVLDFMRGEMMVEAEMLTEREVFALRKDALFYGLPALSDWIERAHWSWLPGARQTVRHEGGEEDLEFVGSAPVERFAVRCPQTRKPGKG